MVPLCPVRLVKLRSQMVYANEALALLVAYISGMYRVRKSLLESFKYSRKSCKSPLVHHRECFSLIIGNVLEHKTN